MAKPTEWWESGEDAMKKLLKYVLTTLTAATVMVTGAGFVQAAGLDFGNSSENILNGGVIAADEKGRVYFANTDKGDALYVGTEKSTKKLSSDAAQNINVVENYIYYTVDNKTGSTIYRMTKSGKNRKELLTTASTIEEMYADSEGTIYYLTAGKVYTRAEGAKKSEIAVKGSGYTHFIPTVHGIITAKGSRQNYTLYANAKKIKGGVDGFYTVDNYLIFNIGSKDYQVTIRDLFDGFRPSDISAYNLGSDVESLQALVSALTDDDCEECDTHAAGVHYVEGTNDDDVDSLKATPGVTSALTTASTGQKNMVKRARQQSEIKWTPVKNITGWGGSYIFKAGTTYTGLPYGQPVRAKYVPWGASLEDFANAVADAGSLMYTSRSTYNKTAPYYSCDCSSFVSWSWDLPSRQYTRSIQAYCELVESQSIYSCQIGDAFVKAGSHTVMVSDVGYRDDQIVYIDIMEQTPPSTKYTRWGEGGTKALSELYSKYFAKGYLLYRSKTRDDVSYTASPAVALDGEKAAAPVVNPGTENDENESALYQNGTLTLSEEKIELFPGESKILTYTSTVARTPEWTTSDSSIAVVAGGQVKGVSAGRAVITLQIGSLVEKCTVYVHPAEVAMQSITAAKDGSLTLKWRSVAGAKSYQIFRKDANGEWVAIANSDTNSYTDYGLALNTVYSYTVRALTTLDGSIYYGNYSSTGASGHTVLETPVLKSVTSASATSQKITWDAVAGAEGYRVYGKSATDPNGKWARLGDTKKTSFTVKKLKTGNTYVYTVRAFFKVNGSPVLSNYNAAGVAGKVTTPAPVLKSAAAYSDHIQVTWKKISGVSSYKVYRKTSGSKWQLVKTVSKNSYTDWNVKYGSKYTYTVRAVAGTETSDYDHKGIKCTYMPGTPELKAAISENAGQVVVSWQEVEGADGYYIYGKYTDSKKWSKIGKVSGSKTGSFTKKNLKSGKTAVFTVRAYWNTQSGVKLGGYVKKGVKTDVE